MISKKIMPISKTQIALILLICIFTLCVTGCAYYAGGTAGTGLAYTDHSVTADDSEVSYLTISGRLQSHTGQPLGKINVSAETPRTTDSTYTSVSGNYSLLVVCSKKEQVTFTFKGSKITQQQRSFRCPNTKSDKVTIDFVLTP